MNPLSSLGPSTGFSSITTCPDVGFSRPAMIRSSVLFPQPEGPTMLTNSPLEMLKLIFSSTSRNTGLGCLNVPWRVWLRERKRFDTSFISHFTVREKFPRFLALRNPRKDLRCNELDRFLGLGAEEIKSNRDLYSQFA